MMSFIPGFLKMGKMNAPPTFPFSCDRGSRLNIVSGDEELLQHGSEGLRGDIMRLTFQGAALRVGEGVCNCLCSVMHERGTRTTVYDQCGDGNACQPFYWD